MVCGLTAGGRRIRTLEVTFLNGFDRHLLEIASSLNRANVGGDERFCYAYSRTSEDPEVSLWFFQFYQRHWAAAITKPSAAYADADADADQWAKRAVDMAEVAHQIIDDTSLERWLAYLGGRSLRRSGRRQSRFAIGE